MADDFQDRSEVVDFQEDSLTEDGLVNKRNKIACKFGNILVYWVGGGAQWVGGWVGVCACLQMCVRVCVQMCMRLCINVYVCLCTNFVCVYARACMYVCVCVVCMLMSFKFYIFIIL